MVRRLLLLAAPNSQPDLFVRTNCVPGLLAATPHVQVVQDVVEELNNLLGKLPEDSVSS